MSSDDEEAHLTVEVSEAEGAAEELHIIVIHQVQNRSQLRALERVLAPLVAGVAAAAAAAAAPPPRASLTVVLDSQGGSKAVDKAARKACGKARVFSGDVMEPLACVERVMAGVPLHQLSSIAVVHDALPQPTFVEDALTALENSPSTPLFVVAPSDSHSFLMRAPALAGFLSEITSDVARHYSADLLLLCWANSANDSPYDAKSGTLKICMALSNTLPLVTKDDERTLAAVLSKTGIHMMEATKASALVAVAQCRLQVKRTAAAFYRSSREDLEDREIVLDILFSKRHGLVHYARRVRCDSKLAATVLVPGIYAELGIDFAGAALGDHGGTLNRLFRKELFLAFPELPQRLRSMLSHLTNEAVALENPLPRRR